MLQSITGDQLSRLVWGKFFSDNPQLRRGDTMTGPVAFARNGTIITDPLAELSPEFVIEAKSLKVMLPPSWELPCLEMGSIRGWVYPYQVLPSSIVYGPSTLGEMTWVMDAKTFEPKLVTTTQEMLDAIRYVIIRFAVPRA